MKQKKVEEEKRKDAKIEHLLYKIEEFEKHRRIGKEEKEIAERL